VLFPPYRAENYPALVRVYVVLRETFISLGHQKVDAPVAPHPILDFDRRDPFSMLSRWRGFLRSCVLLSAFLNLASFCLSVFRETSPLSSLSCFLRSRSVKVVRVSRPSLRLDVFLYGHAIEKAGYFQVWVLQLLAGPFSRSLGSDFSRLVVGRLFSSPSIPTVASGRALSPFFFIFLAGLSSLYGVLPAPASLPMVFFQ